MGLRGGWGSKPSFKVWWATGKNAHYRGNRLSYMIYLDKKTGELVEQAGNPGALEAGMSVRYADWEDVPEIYKTLCQKIDRAYDWHIAQT